MILNKQVRKRESERERERESEKRDIREKEKAIGGENQSVRER